MFSTPATKYVRYSEIQICHSLEEPELVLLSSSCKNQQQPNMAMQVSLHVQEPILVLLNRVARTWFSGSCKFESLILNTLH